MQPDGPVGEREVQLRGGRTGGRIETGTGTGAGSAGYDGGGVFGAGGGFCLLMLRTNCDISEA